MIMLIDYLKTLIFNYWIIKPENTRNYVLSDLLWEMPEVRKK